MHDCKYLGSKLSTTEEIECRKKATKNAFRKLAGVLQSEKVWLSKRMQLFKAYVVYISLQQCNVEIDAYHES